MRMSTVCCDMRTELDTRSAFGIVLIALLWLGCRLWLDFPGLPTTDTIRQLNEGLSGCYTNWKPTLYSWQLEALNRVFPGNGVTACYVIQTLGFALSVAGIAWYYARRNRRYALLVLVLPLFFTVKGMLVSTVGNDEQAAACYLLYIAGVLHASDVPQERRVLRWWITGASFIILGYGLVLRHNAIPAVFVLSCWGGWKLGVRKIWYCVLGALAFLAVSHTVNGVLSYRVLKAEASYPLRSPLVDDVVNLSILDGEWHPIVYEFEDRENLEPPYKRCIYAPETGNWNSPINPYTLYPDVALRKRDYEMLKQAWWDMVTRHPERYLLTKAFFFHQFLLEGRVIPLLCEKLRESYPHITIHMEKESADWRAWVNREFLVMSCIPLGAYLLVLACCSRRVRQMVCAFPERLDSLFFMLVAFLYTGSFFFLVLSATEQRYYVIRASLCCVGVGLFVLSLVRGRKQR